MSLLCDVTPQRFNNDLSDRDPLFGALLLDGDPKSFINADVAKWSWHLDGRHFNSPARVTNLGVEINASPISAKVVFLCIGQKVFSRLTDVAVGNIRVELNPKLIGYLFSGWKIVKLPKSKATTIIISLPRVSIFLVKMLTKRNFIVVVEHDGDITRKFPSHRLNGIWSSFLNRFNDTFNAYCSSHFHSPLSVEPRFEVVGTDYSPVGTGVNTAHKLTLGVSRESV